MMITEHTHTHTSKV